MARTDREMHIEQVALAIAEGGLGAEEAARINRDGWSYDCCLPSQRPYIGESWTRVAGTVLSDTDLAVAVKLGTAWLVGDYTDLYANVGQ